MHGRMLEGMLKRATLLLLAANTMALGQKAQSENDHKPDTWQKMKDCAAQAERVGPGEAEINKGNYVNHYSPKYDRCFVKISWVIRQGEEIKGQGARLVDAFEHDTIALSQTTFPPSESKNVCFVPSGIVGCSEAKDFISEHMRN
jgi:hypothetical protein